MLSLESTSPNGLRRASIAVAVVIGLAFGAKLANAQPDASGFPSKTIRLVVPYAPGGGTDMVARSISDPMKGALGVTVIVDNRAGGSGTIGTDIVAKAPADGHTLLVTNVGLAFNAHLFPKLPYDTLRDLAPVSLVANQPNVIVVHPSLPVKTVSEFVAFAKAKPGAVTYASGGNGSATHLAAELLKMKAHIDIQHIPYKGTGPAMTDVMGGHVQVFVSPLGPALPMIQAGKLRAVAVTSNGRVPALPAVSTVAQAGVAGYEFNTWHGVFAPAKTPAAVIARLNSELRKIQGRPDVKSRYTAQGLEAVSTTPEEFGAMLKREMDKWGAVVRAANVRME